MKSLIKIGLMFLAAIAVFMTSCTSVDEVETKSGKGTVVVKLTDAPFPVSMVDQTIVTIDKIEIRMGTASSTTEGGTSTSTTEEDSEYIVILDEPREFDLLTLQNGVTEVIEDAELEVGSYDLIRMYVSDSEVVLKSGERFDLKIPGGTSSGLKLKLSPALVIEDGVESSLILDFDVSKSFVVQGNPKTPAGIKGFLFKPVIRAMVEKHSGRIEGKVFENETILIKEAHIKVFKGTEEIGSALSAANGTYAIIGLPAGTYSMTCEATDYKTTEVANVVVKEKQKTVQDFKMVK